MALAAEDAPGDGDRGGAVQHGCLRVGALEGGPGDGDLAGGAEGRRLRAGGGHGAAGEGDVPTPAGHNAPGAAAEGGNRHMLRRDGGGLGGIEGMGTLTESVDSTAGKLDRRALAGSEDITRARAAGG